MAKCSKTLAVNVKARLAQLGWTGAELGRRIGQSSSYVSQMLLEKNQSPALDALEKMADALGYSLAELLTSKAERQALAPGDHDVIGFFERVGEVLALARDGHEAEALAFLKTRKPRP